MAKSRYYTVRTKRRKIKTGRLLLLLALCAFLLSIFLSVRLLGSLNAIQDQSEWAKAFPVPPNGGPEYLMLYSVSDSNNRGAVTALTVLAQHRAEANFRAIAVPPDTLLGVPEHGFVRLAQIYSIGGRELLISSVSEFLALPIHIYLEVNEAFLPAAIDLLDADSIREKLQITKGGDIIAVIHADGITVSEQIERRRNVLSAIAAEVLAAGTLGRVRNLLKLSPLIQTNLSWRELLTTMDKYKATCEEAVNMTELPGKEQVQADGSFWLADVEAVASLVNWLTGQQTSLPQRQVAIEVLNGSGVVGAASSVARKLEAEGFIVLRVGNADYPNYEISQVISRVENMDAARAIAIMLPGAQLLKQENPEADVYVTVIVGKNYIAQ